MQTRSLELQNTHTLMQIKSFCFNPYSQCTYLVYERDQALLIDAGMYSDTEQERLRAFLSAMHLRPVGVLITHTHPDHVCGLRQLCRDYPLQPVIFPAEGALDLPEPFRIRAIRTPGHKEDCVCYLLENTVSLVDERPFADDSESYPPILFSGDTLFRESVGRTDLQGGDMFLLQQSLQRLCDLPDNTFVLPGHGAPTTIGHERRFNPWL